MFSIAMLNSNTVNKTDYYYYLLLSSEVSNDGFEIGGIEGQVA